MIKHPSPFSTVKWVYGYYFEYQSKNVNPIYSGGEEGLARLEQEKKDCTIHCIVVIRQGDWNMPNTPDFIEVIPETVGEDTGLVDSKKNVIYEGDILKTKTAATVVMGKTWNGNSYGYDFEVGGGEEFIKKCVVAGNIHEGHKVTVGS